MKERQTSRKKTDRDPIFNLFNPDKADPKEQIRADIIIVIVSIPFVYFMFGTAVSGFLRDPSAGRAVIGLPMIVASLLGLKGLIERSREIYELTKQQYGSGKDRE